MAVISAKCSNCGAELQLDDSREVAFCQYCGHKLILSTVKKSEHTTIIRNEAEILRAQTEAKQAELAEKRKQRAEKAKRIKTILKVSIPTVLVLFLTVYILTKPKPAPPAPPKDMYDRVESTAYTKKAFNLTPNDLLERLWTTDTQSENEYGLVHSNWEEYSTSEDEEYFSSKYNIFYNGEKRYGCWFYKPTPDNAEVPTSFGDARLFYYLLVQTDKENRIIEGRLFVFHRPETVTEGTNLKGYFGKTIPGEIFSIITGKPGDYIVSMFNKADGILLPYHKEDGLEYRYEKRDTEKAFFLSQIVEK